MVYQIQEKISDEQLLHRYRKSGDMSCFAELYKRYMPLVYGVALKYMPRPEDAQDVVMQLFEDLSVKVKEYEIQQFKPWLYSCTRNHCLMELRRRNRNCVVSLDDSFMEFCEEFHPFNGEGEQQPEGVLRECMEALPEKQKVSVTHFFIDELSYKEIEEKTGYALKHVKSFIQNGKRNLKLCLENKGIVSYEVG